MTSEQPVGDQNAPSTVPDVVERLRQWQTATGEAIAALRAERQEAEAQSNRLESPQAVLEYVDFFLERFTGAVADVGRIAGELAAGPRQEHIDALRQLASNAAVEQRRCVTFRDKWINRTLPYEQVRPMLNRMSTLSRDRLSAHRELNAAADSLPQIIGPPAPPPAPGDALDRRALFNRFLRRDGR